MRRRPPTIRPTRHPNCSAVDAMFFDTPIYALFLALVVLVYWRLGWRSQNVDAAGRQLLLLWLVGLAVPRPDRHLDRRRLLLRPAHRLAPMTRRDGAAADAFAGAESRIPRLLQVLQLLRRIRSPRSWRASGSPGRRSRRSARSFCRPGISFYTFQEVAYIVDVYHRQARAGRFARRLRAVHQPVPAPDCRPDPAALATCCRRCSAPRVFDRTRSSMA